MPTRSRRLALWGLALGVFLALLLAPQTRWLVRSQILPPSLLTGRYDQEITPFVRDHPNDYPVQLAGQLADGTQTQLQGARRLVPRFPDSASLRANILRYALLNFISYRDEYYLLQGEPVPAHQADPQYPPVTQAELAAFEADAAAGERLDPDNAYFPFMRSIGLFAARRDADALAAVRRASEKHLWREYYEDEVEGRWRVNDAVKGGREATAAMAVSAAVLFPHYSHFRQVARIVTYKAVLQEQAGHPEAGLALRRQVMRCGDLMRVQSHSLIGSFVGIALCNVARSRPGGGPPDPFTPGLSNEQRAQERLDAYCAYVTRLGHPDAAAEARAQSQDGEQVRHLMTGPDTLLFGSREATVMRLAIALVADWVVFPNILVLLLLGLAAGGLCRLPSVRERRPLPPGSTFGVWAAVLLGLLLAALFVDTLPQEFAGYAAALALTCLLLVGLFPALLPALRRPLWQSLRAALLTIVVLGLFGGLVAWQMSGEGGTLTMLRDTLSLSGSDGGDSGPPGAAFAQAQAWIGLAFGLTAPLLLLLILSIAACARRIPVSVGLIEGVRAALPPLVCLLTLAYGGLILWTARQEARVNDGLEQSLHGEGQDLARLTGQPWPGPVR